MFCPKCGEENPNNAEFCAACGANIGRSSEMIESSNKDIQDTETSGSIID
ncbi:MAG TPA: zinc ribbon domain-containing protein [Methanobacterium sp.]|jgi:uncharacterized membrane protein YvbJ|nr:MAG: zinc ribbon domain-containing protein [Methanobacterium sp.]HOI71403.1 zinc ribbon domain-containing protein [Methanobacterium sp.]HPX78007.1 zinc ribbon domain-containing protein [Methanobacterium sp.]